MILQELLDQVKDIAVAKNIPESDFWFLLSYYLHLSRSEIILSRKRILSDRETEVIFNAFSHLENGEPPQYITGTAYFYGLELKVNPAVLIPRPETEELVEWIISDYREAGQVRILDIGTGSGCIPVSLAQLLPEAQVSSCDVSAEALRIAAMNIKRYGDKVTLFCADILKEELPECQVDVLVSNPPYITESERTDMEANVLDWEPELALFVPDSDPLRFYRRIARKGLDWLSEGGALYFEINRAYGAETVRMLEELGYRQIELRKDLSGNDRMIKAIRP